MARGVIGVDVRMLVATLPEGSNVARWCRQLGISRQSFYKWRSRYVVFGPVGLQERSRAPRAPAGRTCSAVEDDIVRLRKQLSADGLDAGADTIRWHLARAGAVVPSTATVWRILVRRGQINPNPNKRPPSSWRRFERERPNECWQIDATHATLIADTVEVINVIDDHSRVCVASVAVTTCTSIDAWDTFCRATQRWGIPAALLSDNGRAFRAPDHDRPVLFQRMLTGLNVTQHHSRPRHPQTCGKVERFHQTQRRWLDAHDPPATLTELQALLDTFTDIYNHHRPHRALNRNTPAAIWAAQPAATPTRAATTPTPNITTTHVNAQGVIYIAANTSVGIGVRHHGTHLTILEHDQHVTIIATDTGDTLRQLDLQPGRRYYPSGNKQGGTRQPRPNCQQ
jgi:transposase InsO family protein